MERSGNQGWCVVVGVEDDESFEAAAAAAAPTPTAAAPTATPVETPVAPAAPAAALPAAPPAAAEPTPATEPIEVNAPVAAAGSEDAGTAAASTPVLAIEATEPAPIIKGSADWWREVPLEGPVHPRRKAASRMQVAGSVVDGDAQPNYRKQTAQPEGGDCRAHLMPKEIQVAGDLLLSP